MSSLGASLSKPSLVNTSTSWNPDSAPSSSSSVAKPSALLVKPLTSEASVAFSASVPLSKRSWSTSTVCAAVERPSPALETTTVRKSSASSNPSALVASSRSSSSATLSQAVDAGLTAVMNSSGSSDTAVAAPSSSYAPSMRPRAARSARWRPGVARRIACSFAARRTASTRRAASSSAAVAARRCAMPSTKHFTGSRITASRPTATRNTARKRCSRRTCAGLTCDVEKTMPKAMLAAATAAKVPRPTTSGSGPGFRCVRSVQVLRNATPVNSSAAPPTLAATMAPGMAPAPTNTAVPLTAERSDAMIPGRSFSCSRSTVRTKLANGVASAVTMAPPRTPTHWRYGASSDAVYSTANR
mmetsp:Transcript_15496/g.47943  ORF Transcript_15496/g.47943 Transcript_15496/m.47943 type:complete len:358 (+) Transcript_15496:349-1422(+)